MIRAEKLIAQRGDFTLGPVDFDLGTDSYLTLLGPSGAGKTLLLETCMGLIPSKSGNVWLNGQDVTKSLPEQRHISYLPQDLALFPHLNVRENILFGAKIRRIDKSLAEDRLNISEGINRHSPGAQSPKHVSKETAAGEDDDGRISQLLGQHGG